MDSRPYVQTFTAVVGNRKCNAFCIRMFFIFIFLFSFCSTAQLIGQSEAYERDPDFMTTTISLFKEDNGRFLLRVGEKQTIVNVSFSEAELLKFHNMVKLGFRWNKLALQHGVDKYGELGKILNPSFNENYNTGMYLEFTSKKYIRLVGRGRSAMAGGTYRASSMDLTVLDKTNPGIKKTVNISFENTQAEDLLKILQKALSKDE